MPLLRLYILLEQPRRRRLSYVPNQISPRFKYYQEKFHLMRPLLFSPPPPLLLIFSSLHRLESFRHVYIYVSNYVIADDGLRNSEVSVDKWSGVSP